MRAPEQGDRRLLDLNASDPNIPPIRFTPTGWEGFCAMVGGYAFQVTWRDGTTTDVRFDVDPDPHSGEYRLLGAEWDPVEEEYSAVRSIDLTQVVELRYL